MVVFICDIHGTVLLLQGVKWNITSSVTLIDDIAKKHSLVYFPFRIISFKTKIVIRQAL